MEKKKKTKQKRVTKKERKEKEEKEIKNIADSEKVLERRIENLNQELKQPKFNNFVEEPEPLNLSPSLKETNVPQRKHVILERSIISQNPFITKEEEENPIKYNLIEGEKKKEEKYSVISQDYSTIQKEARKQNPDFSFQSSTSNEFTKKNILEDFHKSIMNPIAEENLRSSGKKDDNYFVKPSFVEKEIKPHNPFEKKEIKYDKVEQ